MFLGIPRSTFYYEYYGFIRRLFYDSGVEVVEGPENDEDVLSKGNLLSVDEACLPVKLCAGQSESLSDTCDMVFVPRIEKDFAGRWSCPKIIGLPELMMQADKNNKLLTTDPIDFSNKKAAENGFWKACKSMGMSRETFRRNFDTAYKYQRKISEGRNSMHVEADWEFTPQIGEDEILLPNLYRVLLTGHSYNVYDKFSNDSIIEKLDELGLEAITGKDVLQHEKEAAVRRAGLIKIPFWSTLVNVLGTVLYMKDKVDGIVYLSSFSCGQDPLITELIKKYVKDKPVMVLKLDEHKGTAGLDTRLEAFADLLERRRAS